MNKNRQHEKCRRQKKKERARTQLANYSNTLYKTGQEYTHFVVKEVDGVLVQPEAEGLEEGDVVGHDLLVGEVELVNNDGVDVVVGEEIVDAGVVLDVLEEDVQSLKQLDTNIVVASLLVHRNS